MSNRGATTMVEIANEALEPNGGAGYSRSRFFEFSPADDRAHPTTSTIQINVGIDDVDTARMGMEDCLSGKRYIVDSKVTA